MTVGTQQKNATTELAKGIYHDYLSCGVKFKRFKGQEWIWCISKFDRSLVKCFEIGDVGL